MKGTKPQLVVDNSAISMIPPPPEYFSEYARAEWRRIMPGIIERGVVVDADMGSLENYCMAQGNAREFQAEASKPHRRGTDTAAKYYRLANQAMQTARQLAAELGLTPISRARTPMKGGNGDDDSLLD